MGTTWYDMSLLTERDVSMTTIYRKDQNVRHSEVTTQFPRLMMWTSKKARAY